MQVIKKEILDLFHKGAMRKVSDDEANRVLGFYSKLFVVPKPEKGKFRVIINMKPLNQFIDKKSFKMEGLKDVKYMLKPGCYDAVIDLSDAYYHIKLHEKSRKYTRFIFMGQVMEYTSLPMGLTDSPRIFTRITKFVQSFLRKQGIECVFYIDDILLVGTTYEECERNVAVVMDLLRKLGFILNEKKCHLVPSQEFVYLGFLWNTVSWKVSLKKIREVKVREAAEGLLAGHAVSCRKVAAFLGRVQSTTTAIPFARGSVRVIQWEFNSACLKETDYDKLMYLSEDARNELVWWKNLPEGLFLPITLPQSSVTVTTDATLEDYGIYYDGSLVSGKIPEEFADFSINVKELLPLDIWLDSVGEEVTNCVVTWRVDNNSALQAIRNEGSS